jgi:hypothetical protein
MKHYVTPKLDVFIMSAQDVIKMSRETNFLDGDFVVNANPTWITLG